MRRKKKTTKKSMKIFHMYMVSTLYIFMHTHQSNPAAKELSITGEISFADVSMKYSVLCLL